MLGALLATGTAAPAYADEPATAPASAVFVADEQSELCLTTAIYYESGFESRLGKEAVAQIILNRLRHPSYPKTVCGVIWQGSERRTGCQFSFTCDGSLLRARNEAAWTESRDVARAALAGHSVAEVAQALNYHADYVRPAWAASLIRLTQIGRHIFYGRAGAAVPVPVLSPGAGPSVFPGRAAPSVWGLDLRAAALSAGR